MGETVIGEDLPTTSFDYWVQLLFVWSWGLALLFHDLVEPPFYFICKLYDHLLLFTRGFIIGLFFLLIAVTGFIFCLLVGKDEISDYFGINHLHEPDY